MSSARQTALDLIAFIDASPSPYHAVEEALSRLSTAGFGQVPKAGIWPSGPGRYVVVDGGSLFAWVVPDGSTAATPFRLLGAHTDSPTLRVKPRPDTGQAGLRQIGVEIYGGPLLNSWLDRDLGLAGRVVVRTPDGPRQRIGPGGCQLSGGERQRLAIARALLQLSLFGIRNRFLIFL